MAVTSRRRHPFLCGHRGFGSICHRCKQADVLLAKAALPNAENPDALKAEAARLKIVPRKISSMAVVPA